MNAIDLLRTAASTMEQRAKERGEAYQDVMGRTVALFAEQSGKHLSKKQGWIFMQCLKQARAEIKCTPDDLIDLIAYKALELVEEQ